MTGFTARIVTKNCEGEPALLGLYRTRLPWVYCLSGLQRVFLRCAKPLIFLDSSPLPYVHGSRTQLLDMRPDDSISSDILDQTVTGLRLGGESLQETLGGGATLLLFLRHLG